MKLAAVGWGRLLLTPHRLGIGRDERKTTSDLYGGGGGLVHADERKPLETQ